MKRNDIPICDHDPTSIAFLKHVYNNNKYFINEVVK
jgi:hypothetical protein